MQIWQLFFVLRKPVTILATVFSNLTKNRLMIFVSSVLKTKQIFSETDDAIRPEIYFVNQLFFILTSREPLSE